MLMRPEAAFPYVFAAEGAQHPPLKPPRSTSYHAHRPSPHHLPRSSTLAASPSRSPTLRSYCKKIETNLSEDILVSVYYVRWSCVRNLLIVRTGGLPVIRFAALKSDIICLTWQRKSSAMTRRIQLRRAPCSARRSIMLTGRGRECGVRMTVFGLPDM